LFKCFNFPEKRSIFLNGVSREKEDEERKNTQAKKKMKKNFDKRMTAHVLYTYNFLKKVIS